MQYLQSSGRLACIQRQSGRTYAIKGTRRSLLLSTVLIASPASAADLGARLGEADADVVLNSLLSAYGLPTIKFGKGAFKVYDDFDQDFTFEYPRGWVGRVNRERGGMVFSDFQTADKLVVEVIPRPAKEENLVEKAIEALIVPPGLASGDSKLQLPSVKGVRTEVKEVDGKKYTYMAFTTQTTTLSGYDVKRKHLAVVGEVRGKACVLGCAVRSDQWTPEKIALVQHTIESFRIR